jgi:hypothetical protein
MKMEEIPHAAQAELSRRGSRSGTREPQPYDGLRSEVLRPGGANSYPRVNHSLAVSR